MNLSTKHKQTHRGTDRLVVAGRGGRGGINWEIGIDIYTLLYINR